MRETVRRLLLAAIGITMFVVSAIAQENVYGGYGPGAAFAEEGRATGRWFIDETANKTRAELTRCCPIVSIDLCAVADTGRLPDRYSLKIQPLGAVNSEPVLMFRYRRETLFQDPAFAGVDAERQPYFPCRSSRVLLVRETATDLYELLWEGWQDEQYYRLAKAELHGRDVGDILAFTYCVAGTGGCWQEFFLKTATAPWRPLEKDDTWASVYADMPEGYSLHKSPTIDFTSMTWDRAMATRDDPNCCPSGTIKMTLVIRDGRLSVRSHEYSLLSSNEN
jgi:hypothetical protein